MTDPDGLQRRCERKAGIKENPASRLQRLGGVATVPSEGEQVWKARNSEFPLARVEFEMSVGELSGPIKEVFTNDQKRVGLEKKWWESSRICMALKATEPDELT